MLSFFRWQPGEKHGTWIQAFELPANGLHIPEEEVWWVDLEFPSEEEERLVFEKFMPVHVLTLEDVTKPRRDPDSPPHFPKVEEFADYLFVIANPLHPSHTAPNGELAKTCGVVQLSAIITHRLLITHHYEPLSAIADLSQFLSRHTAQAGRGPDYLFHLVLDRLVDEFAPEVDRIVDRLDEIEVSVLTTPTQQLLTELVHLKRRVISLRKTLILMREVLARLTRGEFELVDDREIAYYRNVYDHLVRYTELIEGAREMTSDLMQTHLAAASNKLNAIMKMLAMVSTVILPMSLIASIYGMNFEVLPETKWTYGYPFALGLMLLVAVLAIWVFRRQRWFER
ncbi:MAG: magnesium/cobalt transporter CorA [Gemmataceae bacterium]|nr:magnesium/cobalt transporter CorA [Gemmataceae bacterium]